MRALSSLPSKRQFGSPAERKLFEAFESMGLEPQIQYPAGVFFLDFAFPQKHLAIEVDGRAYHSGERLQKDVFRQKTLEKKGWVFERFPGWMVWKNPKLPAAKIALRYFDDELSEMQRNHARGIIAQFIAWTRPELGISIIKGEE